MRKSGILLAALSALIAGAQERSARQLTARELFYSAVQDAPKPAASKPQAKAAPVAARKAGTGEVASAPKPVPPVQPPRTEQVSLPDGGRVVPAVAKVESDPAGPPLGLRYTVLKKTGDNMQEVPATTVFHAGDRIQIAVQTNLSGYLYIVSQGSSGTWKPMFPSPEVDNGDNHVEAFRSYTLPPNSRLLFDEQTGTEKLFVVLSREPEPNLEKMIYSLQRNGQPVRAPKAPEPAREGTLLVLANPRIDDATVGFLRTAYARDLVIEKVDEKTAGERKETAVYVVNPSGSADSRVVADLQLVHQ
ncbi:MAG: hypothetical protein C5B51_29495 [Terriglobia bacterium]|nr:MAG: hypothetical protein C5B51_29495 [Terriglobia bacterium]